MAKDEIEPKALQAARKNLEAKRNELIQDLAKPKADVEPQPRQLLELEAAIGVIKALANRDKKAVGVSLFGPVMLRG